MTASVTAHQAVHAHLDAAADVIHLQDELYDVLGSSYRDIRVQVPDGARGPYKGGIRDHPTADLDEVRALARATRMRVCV